LLLAPEEEELTLSFGEFSIALIDEFSETAPEDDVPD
jgi:hypothetical protein